MRMARVGVLAVVALIAGVGLPAATGDAKDEGVKKDLKALQGTWETVSFENDGKKLSAEEYKGRTATYDARGKYRTHNDGKLIFEGTFTIDPTKKPKAIDVTDSSKGADKAKPFLGIYEIKGDTLKVCFAPPGKERPTEFSSQPGSGHLLSVRKRQKK